MLWSYGSCLCLFSERTRTGGCLHLTHFICTFSTLKHSSQFSGYTLVTHNLSTHLASIHLDGTGGEVGRVVGIEQLAIVLLGMALGQEEGFGDTAVGGDVGEVETREEAIAYLETIPSEAAAGSADAASKVHASLRNTTLEDVFVERIGRRLTVR